MCLQIFFLSLLDTVVCRAAVFLYVYAVVSLVLPSGFLCVCCGVFGVAFRFLCTIQNKLRTNFENALTF